MNAMQIKGAMLELSQKDLNDVMEYARSLASCAAQSAFSVGQRVMVIQKTKSTYGTVVKVNRSRAVVKMNYRGRGLTEVNVPFSMMEAA